MDEDAALVSRYMGTTSRSQDVGSSEMRTEEDYEDSEEEIPVEEDEGFDDEDMGEGSSAVAQGRNLRSKSWGEFVVGGPPATMGAAKAAGAVAAVPLLLGLPDEIVVWEILVRLPPRSLLRCRAVCRAWRRATSTRDFLLAHHGRQPTLPLLWSEGRGPLCLDIVPFDHRAEGDQLQLQPVARLGDDDVFQLVVSCDGLLLVCDTTTQYAICNPATRQYAPLPQLDSFLVLGMYPHTPTSEYRLLLLLRPDELEEPGVQDGCHVFALGSCQPPRNIGNGWPEPEDVAFVPVLFRGGLHWHLDQRFESGRSNTIVVFDTVDESFRRMPSPIHGGHGPLFEMDGMLAIYNFTDAPTFIHIWVLQDYESDVWAFNCRVLLPVQKIKAQFGNFDNHGTVVATSCDGDVLFLVRFGKWLHQVDIDGKLVNSFRKGLFPTQLRLKQTLVSHTFFTKLKGYAVNTSPFV